jgi:hypothetical protein
MLWQSDKTQFVMVEVMGLRWHCSLLESEQNGLM